MSNVFLVKEQKLYTPEITVSGIKGVMRQLILMIAADNQMPVRRLV
jgi:4-amino-4-deoxychorismate lyase